MLSDKNRLKIVSCLTGGEKRVSELVEKSTIEQPTISYHLSKLKEARIVKSKRKGREIFYSLNKRVICKNCRVFFNLKQK
jgi:ArsR family transcriptional regulator